MKKLILGIALSIVVLGLTSTVVLADEGAFKKELSKSACSNALGNPVINVEQKVKNDADSGVGGNYWALDNYERHIRVYKTTVVNKYCALVEYEGKFVTFAGASPQNTGTVGAGVKGEMNGGYRATFDATLKATPSKPKFGNLGKFDYQCDVLGNCPGRVSWLGFYFDNVNNFDQPFWGWKYKTGHNGSWVNASTGNSGDITGVLVSGHDDDDD